MFIKDIFSGKYNEEEVHNEFIKFSRGDFKDKYLIDAKKKKDGWQIKTGNEFVNALVKLCLNRIDDKVKMTGVIVSTMPVQAAFISGMKQFMGIKQYKVDGEISKKEILEMMQKNPRVFYALSFSGNGFDLKIKAKAPKSAKPSTSGKEAVADFCTLKTNDEDVAKELLFDVPNATEVKVRHVLRITDIIYPKDKTLSPQEVREKSKRKGVLIRNIEIDGKIKTSEAGFEA